MGSLKDNLNLPSWVPDWRYQSSLRSFLHLSPTLERAALWTAGGSFNSSEIMIESCGNRLHLQDMRLLLLLDISLDYIWAEWWHAESARREQEYQDIYISTVHDVNHPKSTKCRSMNAAEILAFWNKPYKGLGLRPSPTDSILDAACATTVAGGITNHEVEAVRITMQKMHLMQAKVSADSEDADGNVDLARTWDNLKSSVKFMGSTGSTTFDNGNAFTCGRKFAIATLSMPSNQASSKSQIAAVAILNSAQGG